MAAGSSAAERNRRGAQAPAADAAQERRLSILGIAPDQAAAAQPQRLLFLAPEGARDAAENFQQARACCSPEAAARELVNADWASEHAWAGGSGSRALGQSSRSTPTTRPETRHATSAEVAPRAARAQAPETPGAAETAAAAAEKASQAFAKAMQQVSQQVSQEGHEDIQRMATMLEAQGQRVVAAAAAACAAAPPAIPNPATSIPSSQPQLALSVPHPAAHVATAAGVLAQLGAEVKPPRHPAAACEAVVVAPAAAEAAGAEGDDDSSNNSMTWGSDCAILDAAVFSPPMSEV